MEFFYSVIYACEFYLPGITAWSAVDVTGKTLVFRSKKKVCVSLIDEKIITSIL